jgi:hypothetical protein
MRKMLSWKQLVARNCDWKNGNGKCREGELEGEARDHGIRGIGVMG